MFIVVIVIRRGPFVGNQSARVICRQLIIIKALVGDGPAVEVARCGVAGGEKMGRQIYVTILRRPGGFGGTCRGAAVLLSTR